MPYWLGISGLGLNLLGAAIVALTDSRFSRVVLVYLDAVEANLVGLARALREGRTDFILQEVDVRRDRALDRSRSLKLAGWCVLILGLLLQAIALQLAKSPA
jgi:hypothetical protein